MKTQIIIQGKSTSNIFIKNMMSNYTQMQVTHLYGFILTYENKKEAKIALKEAYKFIKKNNPNKQITFLLNGTWLNYDCSTASIINLK